jgi:hypothetical protein
LPAVDDVCSGHRGPRCSGLTIAHIGVLDGSRARRFRLSDTADQMKVVVCGGETPPALLGLFRGVDVRSD